MSDHIKNELHELVGGRHNSARENELVTKLRALGEVESFKHVEFLLKNNYPGTFDVARRVITNNKLKVRLIELHMPEADISDVKLFLRFAKQVLPSKLLLPLLVKMFKTNSGLWERCSYWLPSILGKNETTFIAAKVK